MEQTYTVYYTDGSNESITIEETADVHPNSPHALMEVVRYAELTGRTVEGVGKTFYLKGKPVGGGFRSRASIISIIERES